MLYMFQSRITTELRILFMILALDGIKHAFMAVVVEKQCTVPSLKFNTSESGPTLELMS